MTPERWQQVNEVFHSALKHNSAQRGAFLDQVCGGDQELRKEVESLIASHQSDSDGLIEPYPFEAAVHLLAEDKADLSAGQRIGQYKILSLLGRGGMGEVYLANDSKLGRRVALKLLPSRFTQDQDRVRRFEQEARAASALNHPNILTIFDIEEIEGTHFIATEYIEGRTLRQRMADGRMELREALDVATQVASALSAAHQAGIAHRDIKPENIMLRPDGYAKVLDFGLAKLAERSVAGDTGSHVVTALKTDTGVVIGTTNYMSPEQAKGQNVDQRSDVFSFGTVFYEMVSGEQAFRYDSDVDTMHAIIHDEPPGLSSLRTKVPLAVERVLRRCLEKEPERRYANGTELLAALKQASSTADSGSTSAVWQRWRERWWIALIVVALVVVGTLAVSRLKRAGEATSLPPSGGPVPPMSTLPFTNLPGQAWDPSFSPDGSYLAFVSSGEEDNPDIYVKLVDGGTPVRLTRNPALDISPVWSPDGRYIAFARFSGTERTILVIPSIGGSERRLFSTNSAQWFGWGGRIDWSADGKYIAYSDRDAPGEPMGIFLCTVETQESRRLTVAPEHWGGDTQPVFSPDSQRVAFARMSSADVGDIYVVTTTGGEPVRLTTDNQTISGMSWTPEGREIVFASNRGDTSKLWRILATGAEPQPVGVGSEGAVTPALSRQGNRLAYSRGFESMSTWRVNLSDSPPKAISKIKVLATTTRDEFPQISPNGMQVVFGSLHSGPREVWLCDSDGSNLVKLTNLGSVAAGAPRWSPDGRWIAFDARKGQQSAIFVIGANGGQPRRLTEGLEDDSIPSWSVDGHWIYFISNRSGDSQLWKMSSDGGDAIQVTRHGGPVVFESTHSGYLYYQKDGPGLVWRVPVAGGEDELVLDRDIGSGLFAVTDRGIYFAEPEGKSGVIEFYDLRTRRLARVAAMEKPPSWGFDVSPEGRWLLYSQIDFSSSDIKLVENFR